MATRKSFSTLREGMTPEAQERSALKAAALNKEPDNSGTASAPKNTEADQKS